METVSYTEARNRLKDILETVAEQHVAVHIRRRGGEGAVILSERDYNSLQETLYLLSNPVNAERLLVARARGEAEALSWEEVRGKLEDL
ncbi:MAG: type II toxin-antitoxin system Phd/YefM family antitoxin [Candidatus Competibacteraceae bacterium]|nr:type II toxin-antitoxin system Phd/YefM family antitoxin [Candidatus Competibacteraceae bacterium]